METGHQRKQYLEYFTCTLGALVCGTDLLYYDMLEVVSTVIHTQKPKVDLCAAAWFDFLT